jgi:hypothetical protein
MIVSARICTQTLPIYFVEITRVFLLLYFETVSACIPWLDFISDKFAGDGSAVKVMNDKLKHIKVPSLGPCLVGEKKRRDK